MMAEQQNTAFCIYEDCDTYCPGHAKQIHAELTEARQLLREARVRVDDCYRRYRLDIDIELLERIDAWEKKHGR